MAHQLNIDYVVMQFLYPSQIRLQINPTVGMDGDIIYFFKSAIDKDWKGGLGNLIKSTKFPLKVVNV